MKKLKWILIIIVVLIVAGVGILYLSLDGIIKSVVESQGTEQLKVPTTLDSVNLSLLHGTLGLTNFAIGSPQGFSAPQMMSLGGLSVDTGGVMKLRDEPIHISSIRIDQPKLVIEQAGLKLNFKALIDGMSGGASTSAAPAPAAPAAQPATPAPASPSKTMMLIIDDLTMDGASVVIRPGIQGVAQEIDVAIPSIDLKNIGNADGNQNGEAMKDVVATLIKTMVTKAAESDKVPAEVKVLLNGNLTTAKMEDAAKNTAQKAVQDLQSGKKVNLKSMEKGFLNQLGGSTSQP